MARVRVADFQRDLDEVARGFADEPLGPFATASQTAGGHAGGLLKGRQKWKGLKPTTAANASTFGCVLVGQRREGSMALSFRSVIFANFAAHTIFCTSLLSARRNPLRA